ncbi:hypothetical protein BB559_002854 [Furculomyces boomerangus]|uniref:ATP synthase subunit K, mitochondrial n=2 Tax=Harpellales TaxID=61421 RepID=A0A2T9YRU5_9FUNG|nr:hypothetical protein BB559_004605 [Furculomyces boomerangus]PVU94974.1 hypothetical protein BB559_002854 [Furculomyces boomerangus]PVZ98483.1 hypothetical protein BB558_005506 [Smittium angustum]
MTGGFYTIAGRKIPTHKLAIGMLVTYGTILTAIWPSKTDPKTAPPIKASSDEEFKFIENFIKEAEASDSKH